MNNAGNQTTFSAHAKDDLVVVRVFGPATCRESGRFENLLGTVERRGFGTLVLDLADCPRMDSTFAGALLRLASRAVQVREAGGSFRIVVAGARHPVSDLLDTLCLSEIFESVPLPDVSTLDPMAIEDRDLSREQITALSLDGHERLAALNEENARRFAALLPLLRSELNRLRGGPPSPSQPNNLAA